MITNNQKRIIEDIIKDNTIHNGIIYRAYNTKTHKSYIGQTIKTIETRKQQHYYSKARGKFQEALQTYNESDWEWSITASIEGSGKEFKKTLNYLEVEYIRKYNSFYCGYNSTKGGKSDRKYWK